MSSHDHPRNALEAESPQAHFSHDASPDLPEPNDSPTKDSSSSMSWSSDIEETLRLGDQIVNHVTGIIDLARVEALLAMRTLPKMIMLWLLLMPIMLLTWCAFCVLVSWSVFSASTQIGLGLLTFFLLQVFLLLVCRWLYIKYRNSMTLPYTRAHIDNFVRSAKDGLSNRSETKE